MVRLTLPWADAPWWRAVVERTTAGPTDPVTHVTTWDPTWLPWAVLAVGLVLVAVPELWRATRILVTFVHELGHAAVGILVGRRFTGFVVRADMSGHAVTVGKPRGPGLELTTWAGYPAPAVIGAGLVWTALTGWAPAALGAVALICLLSLVFVRSWSTAGTTLLVGAVAGVLWWWRGDARSAGVLLAVAVLLLLGAWRHWFAVAGSPKGSDPAVLARLTGWPGWWWVGTFLLVIAGASAAAGWLLWPVLRW